MADARFFKYLGAQSLTKVAAKTHSKLVGPSKNVDDVATLKDANENHITFFHNPAYKNDLKKTRAAACFLSEDYIDHLPSTTLGLLCSDPYQAYASAAALFYEDYPIYQGEQIHPSSKIDPSVKIGSNVVVGENATIGKETIIASNTVIGRGVEIGENCQIAANTTITHALISDNVTIDTGVRIGQPGFGFAITDQGMVKIPQLGRVLIGRDVSIGANTTIDRGALGDTIIGKKTMIDNLVQIGHNVTIGESCILAAQVGVSGSTHLEDYVMVGGKVGFAGHLTVGKGAKISGMSGVMSDVKPRDILCGIPAQPKQQYFRQLATLKKMAQKR